MPWEIERYHDISAGHRVYGHEGKCSGLHGHNYRVHFTCQTVDYLDDLGRVIDFSVIRETLCEWLETNWDHKFLLWEMDPYTAILNMESIVLVSFNPTAENMAAYLVEQIGPQLLTNTNVTLTKVRIDETRKCSAIYIKP